MPDVQETLTAQGLNNIASTPAELEAFQKSETIRWGKVIKAASIVAD